MKKRAFLFVLLAGLFAAGAWWLSRPTSVDETAAGEPATAGPAKVSSLPKATPSPAPASVATTEPAAATPSVAAASADETTISDILSAPSPDHPTTAIRLSALVLDSKRSAEQRAEALAHVLNLSAGNEAQVLLPLIRDARLSAEECRLVLDDALNSSLDWQAEAYLAALRSRSEPELRAYIREHLSFLTDGPDLGDNPSSWVEPLLQAANKRNTDS